LRRCLNVGDGLDMCKPKADCRVGLRWQDLPTTARHLASNKSRISQIANAKRVAQTDCAEL
jgi:hypothetical protein